MWCNIGYIPWIQFTKPLGKVGCRPCTSVKLRFKDKWRKSTSRKQPGTFEEITKKINQLITGWINYYGIARMKRFILDTQ
ncbi:group II intron maturase-specific domain-containing protein [Massilibacterium senegalense]|uniref:group II intron maturase-specific domain-containing protein n=1 Tax=Massilibacterium senegalense TaxID=1632858 RepID=UPI002D78A018|nr:group II intron maturase-specific domain-containing protein [Massilibacterium senegalense]